MNKINIENLRKAAQSRFDGAKTPEDVKAATEELAAIEEIDKEVGDLEEQNASLLASYKEIVKREPIANKPEPDPEGEEDRKGLGFAEALAQIKAARNKGE